MILGLVDGAIIKMLSLPLFSVLNLFSLISTGEEEQRTRCMDVHVFTFFSLSLSLCVFNLFVFPFCLKVKTL